MLSTHLTSLFLFPVSNRNPIISHDNILNDNINKVFERSIYQQTFIYNLPFIQNSYLVR